MTYLIFERLDPGCEDLGLAWPSSRTLGQPVGGLGSQPVDGHALCLSLRDGVPSSRCSRCSVLSSRTGIAVRIARRWVEDAECDTRCRDELGKEGFMRVWGEL